MTNKKEMDALAKIGWFKMQCNFIIWWREGDPI